MGAKLLRVLVVALVGLGLPLAVLSGCSFSSSTDRAWRHPCRAMSMTSRSRAWTCSTRSAGPMTAPARCWSKSDSSPLFPDYDQNRGMRRSIPDSYLGAPLNPELVSITDGDGRRARVRDRVGGRLLRDDLARRRLRARRADVRVHVHARERRAVLRRHRRGRVLLGRQRHRVGSRTSAASRCGSSFRPISPTRWSARRPATSATRGRARRARSSRMPPPTAARRFEASAAPVFAYQTITIAVAFEEGTFVPFDSSYLASPWGWLNGDRRARRRGARSSTPIVDARATPAGRARATRRSSPSTRRRREVDALESAVLLGRTTKAIPAEVLEQAVVGSIRIVEGERKFFGGVKLKAQLIDPSRADGDGRLLLSGLFPFLQPGRRVRVRQHRHAVLVGGAEHPQARERGARAPRAAA